MVLLSGDAAAAIANLAKGVVEVTAIEAHPIDRDIQLFVVFLAWEAHNYYL